MTDYSWVQQITVKHLSNRALMLISRFARLVKRVNGNVINLQDPNVAMQVVDQAQQFDDESVDALLNDIIEEFKRSADEQGILVPKAAPVEKEAAQSDTETVTYYRGVAVVSNKNTNKDSNDAPKKTYRGLDVLD